MIPLGDDQGKLRFTFMTLLLVSTIAATFLCQWPLEAEHCTEFARRYGMIPVDVIGALRGERELHLVMDGIVPLFTYGFLHTGPMHAFSCAMGLWAFGMRLEARTSWWRFGLFYVACQLLAAGAQLYLLRDASIDVRTTVRVGATGPVAAVAVTYCLFYLKGRLRIVALPLPLVVRVPPLVALLIFAVLQFHKVQEFAGMSCGVSLQYVPELITAGIGGVALGPLLLGYRSKPRT